MSTSASIFCYGGQIIEGSENFSELTPTSVLGDVFITLKLSKDMDIHTIEDAWERLPDVGPNSFFAFEAVSDQGLIFMDGGRGADNGGQTLARYKATLYNTETNDWSTDTAGRGGAMVQSHAAVLGKDNNTIYIWGGFRDKNTGLLTGTGYELSLDMYMFDVRNSQWTSKNPVETLEDARVYHRAVRVDSSIYYIGGTYPTSIPNNHIDAPMNKIPVYETDTGTWRTENIPGQLMPSPRVGHTVNFIPNTGEIVLIGGRAPMNSNNNNTVFREDYFYILQTRGEKSWSTKTINNQQGASFNGNGIYDHSAVLVGDDLFVMFGSFLDATSNKIVSNNILILDVNEWSWVSSVKAVTPISQSTKDGDDDSSEGDDGTTGNGGSNKSTGKIAGAVVGSVVGLVTIAGAVLFFIRKQSGRTHHKEDGYISNNNDDEKAHADDPPQYNYPEKQEVQILPPNAVHSRNGSLEPPYLLNNATSWQNRLTLESIEKPNLTEEPESSNNPANQVLRIVMTPVKPDAV
ncbi:hypothetical protein BDA99DRAFT_532808 [Phascolomyces articulosus]|uniref:Attractin/MKLN-like beta-propeller domain-containing protein n=1 Tax=Phascolomyces articulosus TaxID=60185 RepID=A0AAD5KA52_9FUNG|nr:hypothetical protein BDA99DRAFT_532808 [Phascolomyces articulosus]